MQRKSSVIVAFLATVILFLAGGCAQAVELGKEQTKVNDIYIQWFKKNKAHGPALDTLWGLKDSRVFGYNCPYLSYIGFAYGYRSDLTKVSSSPSQYKAKNTCWLTGKNAAGKNARLKRDIELVFTKDETTNQWTTAANFSNDRPLTNWDQIKEWLISAFLGPIGIFIIMACLSNVDSFQGRLMLAGILTGIVVVPWVGYVSYLGFGTGFAVFLGIVIYLVISIFVLFVASAVIEAATD